VNWHSTEGITVTTIYDSVPMPLGATEVTDWVDVGKPEQFRCFAGPTREIPETLFG
jgi:hypothetical protein